MADRQTNRQCPHEQPTPPPADLRPEFRYMPRGARRPRGGVFASIYLPSRSLPRYFTKEFCIGLVRMLHWSQSSRGSLHEKRAHASCSSSESLGRGEELHTGSHAAGRQQGQVQAKASKSIPAGCWFISPAIRFTMYPQTGHTDPLLKSQLGPGEGRRARSWPQHGDSAFREIVDHVTARKQLPSEHSRGM